MRNEVDVSSISFTNEQLIADLRKDSIKISDDLIVKAQENDAKTQASIGSLYLKKKINDKAYAWFLKSALQGNADAQYELAQGFSPLYYWQDPNAKVDMSREWCQKAVDQGHADAHGLMGYITDQDDFVASESLPWFHKAVFLGATGWQSQISEWESMGPRYKLRFEEIGKAHNEVMKWFIKDKPSEQITKELQEYNQELYEQLQNSDDFVCRLIEELDEKNEMISRLEFGPDYRETRQLKKYVEHLKRKNKNMIVDCVCCCIIFLVLVYLFKK